MKHSEITAAANDSDAPIARLEEMADRFHDSVERQLERGGFGKWDVRGYGELGHFGTKDQWALSIDVIIEEVRLLQGGLADCRLGLEGAQGVRQESSVAQYYHATRSESPAITLSLVRPAILVNPSHSAA